VGTVDVAHLARRAVPVCLEPTHGRHSRRATSEQIIADAQGFAKFRDSASGLQHRLQHSVDGPGERVRDAGPSSPPSW